MKSLGRCLTMLLSLTAVFMLYGGVSHSYTGTYTTGLTLQWGGVNRTYARYVPSGISGTKPLVIVLHGGGQNISRAVGQAPGEWREVADDEQFYLVYPQGWNDEALGRLLGIFHWHDCRDDHTASSADDVGFINALINTMADYVHDQGNGEIDQSRIYVTGISNGGLMSLRLARELSDRIAAAAPVAANNPAYDSQCAGPVNPIPLMFVNGTQDPMMPWGSSDGQGGPWCIKDGLGDGNPNDCNSTEGYVMGVVNTINEWKTFLNTDTDPTISYLDDITTETDADGNPSNSYIVKETYENGDDGSTLVQYKVVNGGHTYPTIDWKLPQDIRENVGNENWDVESIRDIWAFFENQTRGAYSSGTTSEYPDAVQITYGTYVSGDLLSLTADDNNYYVINSTTSGTRYATSEYTFNNVYSTQASQIDVRFICKSSVSSTNVAISMWNYATGAYDVVQSAYSVGTSEVTKDVTLANSSNDPNWANKHISNGQMKIKIGSSKASNFTLYHEQLRVNVTR